MLQSRTGQTIFSTSIGLNMRWIPGKQTYGPEKAGIRPEAMNCARFGSNT